MTESEYKRLLVCNSRRAPQYAQFRGKRLWWTGIGIVVEGKAKGNEVMIVEDKD